MKPINTSLTLALIASLSSLCYGASAPATASATKLKTVEVVADTLGDNTEQTGSYTTDAMNTATKLDLSVRETPQSVSVITHTQIQDFNLNTVNDALETATGITVEQIETDRTYFTARGFEINNFQVDGVGTPLHWGIADGDMDTAIYDRVEVLRGASGLTAGAGNPSATINLVRKRPTVETQASVKISHGRWNNTRVDGDLAGALTDNLRARVVISEQSKDSYLRDYHKNLSIVYGVVEGNLGENTLITAGASRQKSLADSPMWGALTLVYSDGSLTNFDRSTSTSADWAYWNVQETTSFIELAHYFANGWSSKATYTRTKQDEDTELFYIYGAINPDNSGLTGYASEYDMNGTVEQLEISLNGSFMWNGREQKLVFGLNQAEGDQVEVSLYDYTNGFPAIPNMAEWDGNAIYPNFAEGLDGSDTTDKQTGVFAAGFFQLSDNWKAILGARAVEFESDGYGYGGISRFTDDKKILPYGGLMYDFHKNFTAYVSHTETYMPQSEVDINKERLTPTSGTSKELGIKAEFFAGKLNATAAVFEAEYLNNAAWAGYDTTGKSYHTGADYFSKGFEFEITGEITDSMQATLGYTNLTVDDQQGEVAKTYIPKQSVKLSGSYRPVLVDGLKLGANINWQSSIYIRDTPIKQDALTLINIFANYAVTDNVSFGINLNNVTDEIYFPSLYWSQAFYGAPRNINASITWKY